MKKTILLFSLLLITCALLSQTTTTPCREVLASAGGSAGVAGKNFEFTLGEPFIETLDNDNHRFTQGFNQPEFCPPVSSAPEIRVASGLTIFPNPTAGELYVRFDAPTGKAFQIQIFNVAGQMIRTFPKSNDTVLNSIDCRTLPTGVYYLLTRDVDGSAFFQVPFIKADR